MTAALEQLLSRLHPRRTLDVVDRRTDEAVNTFASDAGVIDDWNAFRTCVSRFLIHLETHLLGVDSYPNVSADFAWGRCARFLVAAFGPNGDKTAFEMARTGNEGGLYAVLKALAHHVAEAYAGTEVAALVNRFVSELTVPEQLEASRKYLEMFGHLLPSELTEASAARLHANFRKLLEEHPRLMRRLERIGR
jgi:hypothetical protein